MESVVTLGVAQARLGGPTLVSRDPNIARNGVSKMVA